MEKALHEPASFITQADALLKKNIAYQKRRMKPNLGVVLSPALLFIMIIILQGFIDKLTTAIDKATECPCDDRGMAINATFRETCATGIPNINPIMCRVRSPQKWPPLVQVPKPEFRAARSTDMPFNDLPDLCTKDNYSCPTAFLITATNRSFAQGLMDNMFTALNSSQLMEAVQGQMPKNASAGTNVTSTLPTISDLALGTDNMDEKMDMFLEDSILEGGPIYLLQQKCFKEVEYMIPLSLANQTIPQELKCIEGLMLWRDSSLNISNEIAQGFLGNGKLQANDITAAYDLSNSGIDKHNVTIWYNSTSRPDKAILRVPRTVNLVSNSYLKSVKGSSSKILLDFVKEMPQSIKNQLLKQDFGTLIGSMFFVFLMQLLLPVIINNIVYEKQQKLRIMMKMHGLGDAAYWIISYAYFLAISSLYLIVFMIFGTISKMTIFRMNSYKVQFLFYFTHLNWQISFAMLASTYFSTVKTASVVAYTYIFGSGLAGQYILNPMLGTNSSEIQIILVELIPGFSLYRGLSEFSKYSTSGFKAGGYGLRWEDLRDSANGMCAVLIIMVAEWLLFLVVACFLDRPAGDGSRKASDSKRSKVLGKTFSRMDDKLNSLIEMEGADIAAERNLVEQLVQHPDSRYTVVCDSIVKVLKGRDGNPDKIAVKGLSLALPRGQCFGMLGPTGAGKTTLLNMLTGFSSPTSGTAYIGGLDIRTDMNLIYYSMGVCPQHDLLWETLTAREHLSFYGKLKNLKDEELNQAIEESLKSVNLLSVIDKQAGQYSGGMKRRLSVAISLIGDPQVVYLDEPSTGLDPASRQFLWNAITQAKRDRAIILTTHSMEEAEYLSDRLGIFVDGSLQCIGTSQELKAKYGGLFVLTITAQSNQDEQIESMVKEHFPKVRKTYHISGTQKFEMPKKGVKISSVFDLMEQAKKKLDITAWGLADTTLEDVFIKVARRANASVL
ncbi:ABC transporter A family protein [Rhynchospora pubera]|uniref:ABC transporter A family protein n=1 Tax=Rhynchospora pubera TaxID=906938 RepID=A0AAV8H0I5_9POAL|nr:ABC transporter A family protein [Rhynchospora pubera]